MGRLGDILELFFGRADPFRTVRANVRMRKASELAARAERGANELWGCKKLVSGISSASSQPLDEKALSIWIANPSRTRVEERSADESCLEPALTVVDGNRWTTRDPEGHVVHEVGDSRKSPPLTDVERHFDPKLIREFFQELSLEARGAVRVASRDCVRLHAVLRFGGSLWPHWLPKNADEYELHADRERGVLLALFGRYKGEVFWSSEVTEVHFDEVLADDLFAYTPQLGEQIRPAVPVCKHLSLATAIARMPFTVFVPTCTPGFDQARLEFLYYPARPKSPRPYLGLLFHGAPKRFLSIEEASEENPEHQEYEWEQLCQNGQEFCISDPGPGRGHRLVALKIQNTFVDIWSDLEREQVIEVAMSLAQAG